MGNKLADEIYSMYWDQTDGLTLREGIYTVPHEWLWAVCREAAAYADLESRFGKDGAFKPTLALWGLSQGGKSSSLQTAIDLEKPDFRTNFVSLLQWDAREPVVFTYALPDQHMVEEIVALNPLNPGEKDATACKTRFTLCDTLPEGTDPRHPVEIRILGKAALRKTLAVGYINNIQLKAASEDDPRLDPLSDDDVIDVLTAGATRPVDRQSLRALIEFVDVLKVAKAASSSRYRNISKKGFYERVIGLHEVSENLEVAFNKIFWADNAEINDVYDSGARLIDALGGKRVYSTFAIVKLLLNMQTHVKATGNSVTEAIRQETCDTIRRIRKDSSGDTVKLRFDGQGERDFCTPDAFANLQAVVGEIVIPVNKSTLDAVQGDPVTATPLIGAFGDLLGRMDLLDLPGVTWKPAGTKITASDDDNVYSDVVKLGKTFAAACDTTGEAMDDMCIFISLAKHGILSPSIDLLARGVYNWAADRLVQKTTSVFTDVRWFIEDVAKTGVGTTDHFSNFDNFGRLVRKDSARIMAAHYVFRGRTLDEANKQVFSDVLNRTDLARRLAENFGESFGLDKVISSDLREIDSRETVIRFMSASDNIARARDNVRAAMDARKKRLIELLELHAPKKEDVSVEQERERAIRLADGFKAAVEAKVKTLNEDGMRNLGGEVLMFANVSASLPEFPREFFGDYDYWPYTEKVIAEIKRKKIEEYAASGRFRDTFNLAASPVFAAGDEAFFIGLLVDLVCNEKVQFETDNGFEIVSAFFFDFEERWMQARDATHGPNANHDLIRKSLRGSLAMRMEDELLGALRHRQPPFAPQKPVVEDPDAPQEVAAAKPPPPASQPMRGVRIVQRRGVEVRHGGGGDAGHPTLRYDPSQAAHYRVIGHFTERVVKIKDVELSAREAQKGDAALFAFLESVKR